MKGRRELVLEIGKELEGGRERGRREIDVWWSWREGRTCME